MSFFKTHSHKIISYSIIAVISVFIVAASFWYKSQRITEENQERSMLTMFMQKKEQSLHEKTPGYEVGVEYPRFNEGGADSANATLRTLSRDKVADFTLNAKEIFAEASKNPKPEDIPSHYISSFKEVTNTSRYVTILVTEEYYIMGAAHPVPGRETYIFDKQEKKLVMIPELFTSTYLAKLSELAREAFKEQNTKESYTIDISKENHGLDPIETNFSRVLPDEKGITVYFEVYQVGPYAAGLQQVFIPYEKLQGVINKNSVLGTYSK
jgi:hypothetical protein